MRLIHHLLAGLKALFRKEAMSRDLDEELTQYLQCLVDEKVRNGATAEEALRSARLELGSLEAVKQEVRTTGWESSVENLGQDIRYGIRLLRKSPMFTAAAVGTIAIGIGATSAMFSVVDAVLLRPLPYPHPDRLLMLGVHQRGGTGMKAIGVADFLAWRDHQQSFERVAAFDGAAGTFALSGLGTPQRIPGNSVTADFFAVLGVQPMMGRFFEAGDDRPGAPALAVISERFWRDYLAEDPIVVGKNIVLDGTPRTIIGVAPGWFRFPSSTAVEVWGVRTLPHSVSRPPYSLHAFGRLKPEVTARAAEAEFNGIAMQVSAQYPNSVDIVAQIIPLKEWMVENVSTALLVLFGAIALLLLIAVVNVASLLLARATLRVREMAVRMALGATRGRVTRQLLTESIVLSVIGGAIGLLLAYLAVRAFVVFGPGNIPRLEEIGLNLNVLVFTFITCVGSGIGFGLAPAFTASRTEMAEPLKLSQRSMTLHNAHRTQRMFVVAQIALALLLMIGSGLLIRSFVRLRSVDPGVRTDHVITAALSLPDSYDKAPRLTQFWMQFLQKVESLPGVNAAGITMSLPPNLLEIMNPFTVEGQDYDRNRQRQLAEEMPVSPDYFRALGIPLIAGRYFSASDKVEGENDPMIVIINHSMAERYFPGKDPIGRRIQTGDPDPKAAWETIVGVVGDVKYSGLDAAPTPTIYVPFNENAWASWSREMYLVVRATTDPQTLISAIRLQLKNMDVTLPLAQVRTMEQLVDGSVMEERFRTWLIGGFAVLALLLSAIGIYAVVSYSVSQRTQEIGLRIALGAKSRDVLTMVLVEGVGLLAVGLLLGIGGALLATRILRTLLYSTSTTDLLSFVSTSLIICGVALLACYVPARRAAKVDPMIALRAE